MTRREEIVKAAHEFYKGDEVSTFVVAAQWADRTMIDKACDWLKKHYAPAGFVDGIFRKAMLEEE